MGFLINLLLESRLHRLVGYHGAIYCCKWGLDVSSLLVDFHDSFEVILGAFGPRRFLLVVCLEEDIIFGGHIILTACSLFDGLREADICGGFLEC